MVTSRKKTVEIDLIVDDSQASKKLKGVGDDAKKLGDDATKSAKGFSGLSTGMKATAVAAGAFVATEVVDFLGDAVTNALADQKAQDQLALAVENTTDATQAEVDAVADYIDKTQQATGITDDELRPAFANLVRATHDVTEAQALLNTAMDISTATGKPLEAVTMALSKAYNGNIGALGRLGLKVRDASGNYLTFEEAVALANETFAGATDAMAESAEGKMKRLTIAFDEAKEELGAAFIPVVLEAADAVLKLMDQFENPPDASEIVDPFAADLVALNENKAPVDALFESFKALFGLFQESTPVVDRNSAATRGSREAMQEVIPVLDKLDGQYRSLTEITRDQARASEEATDAFYDYQDALKAQIDPVFAVYDAEQKLADAHKNSADARHEYGTGTPEHIDALASEREAWYKVQAATKALGDEFPVTAESLRSELEKMGIFTKREIDGIIAEFERVNAFRFRVPTSVTSVRHITGGGVQEHSGGHVPGVGGEEVPILARAGEFVSQGGTPAHNNGNAPVSVVVNVDGKKFIEELVVPQLARYSRRNGGLGF